MTHTNLGINSASTNDWLEAMKNQSSSGVEPRHTGTEDNILTKEHFEEALTRASRRISEAAPKTRKKG